MSTQSPQPPDDAFPVYRSRPAERDQTRRRVRQVTALLGASAAVGAGAFALGLAHGTAAPATVAATVPSTTAAAAAPPPASLSGYSADDGRGEDDGAWHRLAPSTSAGSIARVPTTGGAGSATTTGGSSAVTIP